VAAWAAATPQAPPPHLPRSRAVPAKTLESLRPYARAGLSGSVAVALMLFWSVDDGGYDAWTWYWGALVALAALAVILTTTNWRRDSMPRPLALAIVFFALYVAWSYLSMLWAQYAGLALQGSNRALLYLLVFALIASVPWSDLAALATMVVYAVGVGVIGVVLLFRFAIGTHVANLFFQGRLVAPTGYVNSTAALFTIGALIAIAIAARRSLPGLLRGALLAFACADLEIALTVQSRGWLFTLPVVAIVAVLAAGARVRTTAHALVPVAGALLATRPLLRVYQLSDTRVLQLNAQHAGKIGLLCAAGAFVVATLLAWAEQVRRRPPLSVTVNRVLAVVAIAVTVAGVAEALYVVSDHAPGPFISRELHAFTANQESDTAASHFVDLGTQRYDFWRVAWEAFRAHPIGGLGQDNFGDYYLTHRRTSLEPVWTHSIELRLLAHTGAVGALLFAGFLIAALIAAIAARRRGDLAHRMLVGAALLALIDWFIHGSIDWFWEMPALSGPALGFLALAGRLRPEPSEAQAGARSLVRRIPSPALAIAGATALVAATIVLGLPFLSQEEMLRGESAAHTDVSASLSDFSQAHTFDPLLSDPGELGGTVALTNGRYPIARARFTQAVHAEPGDWFAWLGLGLADSTMGDRAAARTAFDAGLRANSMQLAVRNAVKLVDSRHPLSITKALDEVNYLP
jgi:hypothetical protein